MATSSKPKSAANAEVEAHSALTNRMISAKVAYNLTRPYKHGKAY